MATVFIRRGNKIHHFWTSELWFARAEPPGRTCGMSISCGRCGASSTALPKAGAPTGGPASRTDGSGMPRISDRVDVVRLLRFQTSSRDLQRTWEAIPRSAVC